MQSELSILCVITRMLDKITVYWLLINPLKMWQSSNVWEQQQQMKIPFTKKLRANYFQGMLH